MKTEREAFALSPVLTFAQVAKRAKRSQRSISRYLLAKNEELGGALLVNVGRGKIRPRWTISEDALLCVAEQWFNNRETIPRQFEELREENESLQRRVNRLEKLLEVQKQSLIEAIAAIKTLASQASSRHNAPTRRKGRKTT